MDSVRVGIHQAEPGSGFGPEAAGVYRDAGVRVLVLPEYFWIRPEDRDHRDAAAHADDDLREVAAISKTADWVVVGGTVVERDGNARHNACPVFHRGVEIARYRKIHLMPGEARHGITPGTEIHVVEALGLRLVPVVCADVLYPDTFARVAALAADLIPAPMSSPYRPADTVEAKDTRDREIFLDGARRAGAAIVKAGGTGTLFGRPLQGRCLAATPRDIVFRTPFDQEREPRSWIVDVPLGTGD